MEAVDFLYQELDKVIERLENGNGENGDIAKKEVLYELIDEAEKE